MAFILTPKNGEEIMINAWNWRPTIELLRDGEIIDDALYEAMGTGLKADVDATTANRIADFLDVRLRTMKPGQRVRADLTVTDIPKKPLIITPGVKVDEIDAIEAYSATYEWLVEFRDFSRTSGGFEVG